jgi:hypothetical protein
MRGSAPGKRSDRIDEDKYLKPRDLQSVVTVSFYRVGRQEWMYEFWYGDMLRLIMVCYADEVKNR